MLEDVLKPGSDIGTIVVHHTSRFTRNATQARVVKEQLHHLVEQIEADENRITVVPKEAYRAMA